MAGHTFKRTAHRRSYVNGPVGTSEPGAPAIQRDAQRSEPFVEDF